MARLVENFAIKIAVDKRGLLQIPDNYYDTDVVNTSGNRVYYSSHSFQDNAHYYEHPYARSDGHRVGLPDDPAITIEDIEDIDGNKEGIVPISVPRITAQRQYAKTIGVPFQAVQCVLGYIDILSRQEHWERTGRMQCANEIAKSTNTMIRKRLYGFDFVNSFGDSIGLKVEEIAPRVIPNTFELPSPGQAWREVDPHPDEVHRYTRVRFCREF